MFVALHHIEAKTPTSFMITLSLGSMGLHRRRVRASRSRTRDRPVVSICGDGCFSMALGDIACAAQNDIPLIVAVLNDSATRDGGDRPDVIYGRTPEFSMP